MKKKPALGLIALTTIAVTSCGMPAAPSPDAPVGDNRPATAAVDMPASPGSALTQQPGTQAFGGTYTYEDGLAMTIGIPQPFTPGEYAVGTHGFTQFVMMDVVVVNQTGTSWDPGLFYATMQSGNQEASRIFDPSKLGDTASTMVLDGREASFKMAFGVTDPADLVLEVQPDFNHKTTIYVQES